MDDRVSQSRRGREVDNMQAALRAIGTCSLQLLVAAVSAATSLESASLGSVAAEPIAAQEPLFATIADEGDDLNTDLDGNFVVLADSDDSPWCDCCAVDCGPAWTARVGAVILDRSKPEGDVLARPIGGLFTVSAGGDFDFGWDGGVDIYLARQFASGLGVEVRYFDVDSNAGFDYGDTGDIRIGHTTVVNLFDVDAAYRSKLNSTEINLRMPGSDRVTWLAGFRWLELGEQLNYDIDLLSLVNNDFNWETNNHLYGGQMGLDLQLWDLRSPLAINAVLKAGVFGNNADNHFRFRVNDFSVLQGGADQGAVAFVGDIGINLSYRVTRHVSLMGGYQLLWINGAALASDQAALTLQRVDLDVITTQGDLFYHGAQTGVVVSW
jgi:Putative beta barrel porin-7 (BBP7)